MSQSSLRSPSRVGHRLAEVGAVLECLIDRDRKLNGKLGSLLARIPRHFIVSHPLTWREVPSTTARDPCAAPPSAPGASATNHFTLAATIMTQPVDVCDSTSSDDSCPTKKKKRSRSRGLNLRAANPEEKKPKEEKKDKKTKSKFPKLKAQSISPQDVSDLYQKLDIKGGGLKGGRKNKPSPCDSSSDDSSESECEKKKCVSACAPCPSFNFPRSVPNGLVLQFQFSPLRTTLQNCDSILQHRLSGTVLDEIEANFRAGGVRIRGSSGSGRNRGILRLLPKITSAVFSGYGARGQVLSLHAILDLRKGVITVGRATQLNVQSTTRQLFGVPRRPLSAFPQFVTFGLGERSAFLSGWFNFSVLIDLTKLREFLETINNNDFGSNNNNNSGSTNSDVCDMNNDNSM